MKIRTPARMPYGSRLHLNPKPDSFKLHNIGAFIITNTIVGFLIMTFIGIMYPKTLLKAPILVGFREITTKNPPSGPSSCNL